MEIKGNIQKIGFLFGTFNMLKEDIPKSIAKEDTTTNGLYNRKNNAIRTLQGKENNISV